MKWSSLLKGFKDKVGLTGETGESSSALASVSPNRIDFGAVVQAVTVFSGGDSGPDSSSSPPLSPPYSREKNVSELDFKRYWEEFRSSGSEKDKEVALNRTVDIFCRLVKKQNDVVDLVNILVETHIFSFVIGRAFVTDIEKLRIHNTEKSLHIGKVMDFFSELTKDGINPGSNFLYAVEVLVSGSNDKQSFLDSGILCCLIYILNAFLNCNNSDKGRSPNSANLRENISSEKDKNTIKVKCLEVEGRVVHIMKALSTHPSAALSLIEDDSLQLLFQMVTTGSSTVFSRFKHGHVPLHTIQLYRHAMQILNLLLVNDNGSTAKYIRKHQLIKVLLVALKDFNPDDGDSVYTMGIVDLLMECVELSYKPGAGSIRLKEDIHNAHGYQFLVQFALILSNLHKKHVLPLFDPKTTSKENSGFDEQPETEYTDNSDTSPQNISPALSRLLDVLVNLAQTGPDPAYDKPTGHNRSRKSSIEKLSEENWENVNAKIRDLDAIQMLQDIFLKSPDKAELQSEVLNRLFKIFTGHLDNYKLCQKIRTVTLFILNMAHFPSSSHEIILKILEYAVTVLNCVPEQELFTLCCLLEQSKASNLKLSILSLFVKLLSFDRQYIKVLHEVGLLELLIAELKRCKFIFDVDGRGNTSTGLVNKPLGSLKNLTDNKDAILSSPRSMGHDFGSCSIFEDECTVKIAWICLDSILKKTEANQSSFRSANGFTIVLPFLISDIHRSEVLRILSSLIIEDRKQAHQGELEALIECLKSGMVQSQYRLLNNAKCDIFGALWRILVGNSSAQRVFGESTGFSLLFTTLHSFKREGDYEDVQPSLQIQMNIFSFLLRVMTAAVCNNAFNRSKLHATIASPTFYDLLRESNFLSVDWEKQVIQLLLELALEIAIPPSSASQAENYMSSDVPEYFLSNVSFDTFKPDDYRVYNSSIIGVLIRSLLLFTPKVQLDLLIFLQKVASAHSFNRESLTSTGCVGLLLDIINPFLTGSSSLLVHALQIIQILGSYRLSTSELRVLMKYILKMKSVNSGHYFFDMMEIIIQNQDTKSDNGSLSPFVEMDMSKIGRK